MSKIHQVKISLKHKNPKYKTQTITGIVVASEQSKAVSIAMENTEKLIKKNNLQFIPKLCSATALPNDFVYNEADVKEDKTEAPIESEGNE